MPFLVSRLNHRPADSFWPGDRDTVSHPTDIRIATSWSESGISWSSDKVKFVPAGSVGNTYAVNSRYVKFLNDTYNVAFFDSSNAVACTVAAPCTGKQLLVRACSSAMYALPFR